MPCRTAPGWQSAPQAPRLQTSPWVAYVAFSAYIKCAPDLNTCFPSPHTKSLCTLLLHLLHHRRCLSHERSQGQL